MRTTGPCFVFSPVVQWHPVARPAWQVTHLKWLPILLIHSFKQLWQRHKDIEKAWQLTFRMLNYLKNFPWLFLVSQIWKPVGRILPAAACLFSLGSDWNKHMRRIPEDTYRISYLRKGSKKLLIFFSYHKVSDDGVLKNLPGPSGTLLDFPETNLEPSISRLNLLEYSETFLNLQEPSETSQNLLLYFGQKDPI